MQYGKVVCDRVKSYLHDSTLSTSESIRLSDQLIYHFDNLYFIHSFTVLLCTTDTTTTTPSILNTLSSSVHYLHIHSTTLSQFLSPSTPFLSTQNKSTFHAFPVFPTHSLQTRDSFAIIPPFQLLVSLDSDTYRNLNINASSINTHRNKQKKSSQSARYCTAFDLRDWNNNPKSIAKLKSALNSENAQKSLDQSVDIIGTWHSDDCVMKTDGTSQFQSEIKSIECKKISSSNVIGFDVDSACTDVFNGENKEVMEDACCGVLEYVGCICNGVKSVVDSRGNGENTVEEVENYLEDGFELENKYVKSDSVCGVSVVSWNSQDGIINREFQMDVVQQIVQECKSKRIQWAAICARVHPKASIVRNPRKPLSQMPPKAYSKLDRTGNDGERGDLIGSTFIFSSNTDSCTILSTHSELDIHP
mmetsp:Transcript_6817/g.12199  ORF Transcript_6817/g.12199 Transcript_6817/m.12199 type:complete len:418 (-) Transcript_6817:57-1310(-)